MGKPKFELYADAPANADEFPPPPPPPLLLLGAPLLAPLLLPAGGLTVGAAGPRDDDDDGGGTAAGGGFNGGWGCGAPPLPPAPPAPLSEFPIGQSGVRSRADRDGPFREVKSTKIEPYFSLVD